MIHLSDSGLERTERESQEVVLGSPKKMQSIDVHYMDFHPCVRILVVIVNALMEKQDLYFLGIIV